MGTLIELLLKRVTHILCLLFLVITGFAYIFQNRLLFRKSPPNRKLRKFFNKRYPKTEHFLVTEDGTTLHGYCIPQISQVNKQSGAIIYFGGNRDNVLNALYNRENFTGVTFCTFNYRGYGLSKGVPSEKNLVSDAIEIYNFVASLPYVDKSRIVVIGRSLGTGVAIQLAALRTVWKLILISPYDSMIKAAQDNYPWLPVRLVLKHTFLSENFAPKVQAQSMIIYSSKDDVVLPKRTREIIKKFKVPPLVKEFKKGTHRSIMNSPDLWPLVKEFTYSELFV